MFAIVSYDVPTGRTEIFRKLLTRYLTHEQNSVFMGRLTDGQYQLLLRDLSRVAEVGDRLLTVVAQNQNNVKVQALKKNAKNGILEQVAAERHDRGFDII